MINIEQLSEILVDIDNDKPYFKEYYKSFSNNFTQLLKNKAFKEYFKLKRELLFSSASRTMSNTFHSIDNSSSEVNYKGIYEASKDIIIGIENVTKEEYALWIKGQLVIYLESNPFDVKMNTVVNVQEHDTKKKKQQLEKFNSEKELKKKELLVILEYINGKIKELDIERVLNV